MGKSGSQRSGARGFLSMPTLAITSAVVLALAIGGALIATHRSAGHPAGTLAASSSQSGTGGGHRSKHHPKTPPPPPAPLAVSSIVPSAGSSSVAWQSPITVRYSEPLSKSTPLPTLSPAVPGSWDPVGGDTLVFDPLQQYVPFTNETVTVPQTSRSAFGTTLPKAVTSTFTVAGTSVLRLQERLAELGYLPVAFTPKGEGTPAPVSGVSTAPAPPFTHPPAVPASTGTTLVAAPGPGTTTDIEPSEPGDIPLAPLAGTFTWRFTNIPTTLAAQWSAGVANEVTTGAVMAFESAHGLTDDGEAGPVVWQALLKAAAARQVTTAPYDYVYVSEANPEYVTIWRDGVNVFTTLANTGIQVAPTQAGTWAVYRATR